MNKENMESNLSTGYETLPMAVDGLKAISKPQYTYMRMQICMYVRTCGCRYVRTCACRYV